MYRSQAVHAAIEERDVIEAAPSSIRVFYETDTQQVGKILHGDL
jgi:hypothetical protein